MHSAHNSPHMAWYCKTYAEGTVTEGPLGREKRWAVAPKRQAWYLTGLGDGFSRRTYNTHTQKSGWHKQRKAADRKYLSEKKNIFYMTDQMKSAFYGT